MPVYGINTVKIDERLNDWVNTYYVTVPERGDALAIGEMVGTAEATIHSTLVTVLKAHVWRVGAATVDMGDIAIDLPGALLAGAALPPWFTAEVNMPAAGSYPGWKRYRTRVDRGYYEGPDWTDAYITILDTFCDVWDELTYKFCTRDGVLFSGMDPNAIPQPLQLSKKWYNRTPTP